MISSNLPVCVNVIKRSIVDRGMRRRPAVPESILTVGKERTSVVSTPSLTELYRFAMNFLLVRKRKRKRNRDGRKRRKYVFSLYSHGI